MVTMTVREATEVRVWGTWRGTWLARWAPGGRGLQVQVHGKGPNRQRGCGREMEGLGLPVAHVGGWGLLVFMPRAPGSKGESPHTSPWGGLETVLGGGRKEWVEGETRGHRGNLQKPMCSRRRRSGRCVGWGTCRALGTLRAGGCV